MNNIYSLIFMCFHRKIESNLAGIFGMIVQREAAIQKSSSGKYLLAPHVISGVPTQIETPSTDRNTFYFPF